MTWQTILYFASILLSGLLTGILVWRARMQPLLPGVRTQTVPIFIPRIGFSAVFYAFAIFRFPFLNCIPAQESTPQMTSLAPQEKRSLVVLGFILILFASGLVTASYFTHQNYDKQFRTQLESQLPAIAVLKADELRHWRARRMADAEVLYDTPAFAALVQKFIETPYDAQTGAQLQPWLDFIRQVYAYERIFLLNSVGLERVVSPAAFERVAVYPGQLGTSLKTDQVTFLAFHRDSIGGFVSKTDTAEVFAPLPEQPWQTALLLGILALAIGASLILAWWQHQRLNYYRAGFETAESLRKSQEQYRKLIELAPDGIFIADASGKYVDVNPSGCAMLGYTRNEILSKQISDLVPPEDMGAARLFLAELQQGKILFREQRLICKDGSLLPVEISGQMLPNGYFQSIIRDIGERKQTEEIQRQEHILLRTVIDNIPDAVYIKDSSGRKTLTNRIDLENIGIASEAQILGKTDWELFPPDVAARFDADDQVVLKSGQPVLNREELLVTVEGQESWLRTSKLPLRDENGSIVGLLGIGHDITERKQVEEKLIASEVRYRRLFEAARDGILILDAETGVIVDVNPFLIEMLGSSREEICGKELWELGFFKDITENKANFLELQQKEYIRYEDLPLETADGRKFHVEFVSNVYLVDHQKVIQCNIRDITVRKRVEDALRDSQAQVTGIFNSAMDAILIVDEDQKIIIFNPAAEQMFGCPVSEAIGQTLDRFLPEYVRKNHREYLRVFGQSNLTKRSMKTPVLGLTCLRNSGEAFASEISISQLEIGGRKFYTAIVRDVTERKRAEEILQSYSTRLETQVMERTRELRDTQEQLVRQERLAMLGQLAGSIGHELRNPLGVISNAIYYLKMSQPKANNKVREYLEIIEKETRVSDKIVADLLDFTRTKSVDREPAFVSELIDQTLKRFPVPPSVQVALEIPADLPQIYADPQQIIQVLGNLVTNASQAMTTAKSPNMTKLVVFSATHGDMMIIAVSDTGPGIPPENMDKIFQPLFTTKTKGIGLGLAISKKLAEANGGKIEVQSVVGQGSTFTVYLPVYRP